MTDVYADVLFLINFSMDAIALYICGRLCAVRMRAWRIALAAAVGGVYAVGILFLPQYPLPEGIMFLSVCLLMSCIGLRPETIREAIGYGAAFFVCSALCGGIMSAAYALLANILPSESAQRSGRVSPFLFVLLGSFCLLAAVLLTHLRGVGSTPERASAEFVVFGKRKRCEGIADTGNFLREPLSGAPCVILPLKEAKGILSDTFFSGAAKGDVVSASLLPPAERRRFRLVPASGIGGSGYLYGIRPEKITIEYRKRGKIHRAERDAVLCFCPDGCGIGGDIGCVIPKSLL